MSRLPKEITRKQYRKIETLLADFRELIVAPAEDRAERLIHCAWQICQFVESLSHDASQVTELLGIVKLLRTSSGPGVVSAERIVMERLVGLAYECAGHLLGEDEGLDACPSPDSPVPDANEGPAQAILSLLDAFARESFAFKRPHDSFGGERRSLAYELLGAASAALDLSDIVALAHETLKAKKAGRDAFGALHFLEEYYSHNDERVSDELVDDLEAFAKRTDSRSLAVGALNLLVETNCISDLGALSRIDDWKDAHRFY